MKNRGIVYGAVLAVGVSFACVVDNAPTDPEVQTREISAEELAPLLENADEVIANGEIVVTNFRSADSSCGITVSSQEFLVVGDHADTTISASCSHGGCAGNPGGCQPSGCQPYYNETTESYFCTEPVCTGDGCAPIGCTLKTTLTRALN